MNLAHPFFAIAVCAVALPAQAETPKAQQFLFDDYTTVMSIDMKKFRDTGVWDEIGSGPLKMVLGMVEVQFGFSFEELDQAMLVRKVSVDGDAAKTQDIATIETSVAMGEPVDVQHARYSNVEVGDYTMMVDQWSEQEAMVQVTPKLRVSGPVDVIRTVLEGEPRTGLPSGDVMSLTVGQNGMLAHGVFDFRDAALLDDLKKEILPDAEWPVDDQPTFMCFRVLVSGDEDDPHLALECVLRHGQDGAGLVASEKAVTSRLQELCELKEARLFRPLLKKVQHKRDGTDAVWRLDLGRARNVAGMLSTLAPFMLWTGAEAVAQPLKAEDVVIEEIKPPKKIKQAP